METYAPSVAGVKATLVAMKFDPTAESVRAFNARFDLASGAAPTNSIPESDLKQYYLKAIAKGDVNLMRDAIWSQDIENTPLAIL